jgi:hypothetical protein
MGKNTLGGMKKEGKMKLKTFFLSLIIVLLFFWLPLAYVSFGAEGYGTATWEMAPESPDADGFTLYSSEYSDMSQRRQIVSINDGSVRTVSFSVIVPDNAITTLYFAMTAYNEVGESSLSNIASKTFDTTSSPSAPTVFRVEFTVTSDGDVVMRMID